jgi:hypothetical protein
VSRVRSCLLAALFVVVGVVLSPRRAAAATIPTLFAYDGMVPPTATTVLGRPDAVPTEAERPAFNAYDAALLDYNYAASPHVLAGGGAVHAYDDALEHADQREVHSEGAIYAAAATTTAAEEVGLGTRAAQVHGALDPIAQGMRNHRRSRHISRTDSRRGGS